MATGTTELADLITPSIFTAYTQQVTEQKARLIQAGVLVRDAELDGLLAGGGITFNSPSFKDVDNDSDNVSSDTGADLANPAKIGTSQEIAVRLNRNQVWAAADLAADIAGADPMQAIGNRVGFYWARRQQAAFVATMQGVFADNAAAPTGTDTHTLNDMTVDISGAGFTAGVTDFSAEAFIDATVTMGDSMQDLAVIMVHSVVYAKMQKNNLIDFIPDAEGRVVIPTFLGRQVVIDDGVPNPAGSGAAATSAGIYHSWLFGAGAVRLGVGQAKVPTETDRLPMANGGGGEERLHNRVVWCMHPVGHAFIGSTAGAPGGPSNAATANNLAAAGSWSRIFPERKQIKIARLITRES